MNVLDVWIDVWMDKCMGVWVYGIYVCIQSTECTYVHVCTYVYINECIKSVRLSGHKLSF